ncbi:MBL fold metallo-hydrolase [Paenibacillus hexagrammi]|uniref:MBL fold metallo-hydrolase n=1 Tax=Paenibacillus hexagrammi TaxID=2908839 RepID=A0ABY3SM02_9BACL|nr:MBL fold metallo-hydrolase [Paenibacillus sp. YPD9-1]UJF34976.1 MBL fold metallo-hydrolase [Paenibacillus sp. YPD9-1]
MESKQLAKRQVKLRTFAAGYCTHPEWVTIRGGSLRSCRIPALFACIEHPSAGILLWDTGYSERFFAETDQLPNRLYRMLTPVHYSDADSAAKQLRAAGIEPEQVKAVIISHFHADHIAGLRDFPHAAYIYLPEAYEQVKHLKGLAALRRAFLPRLLPDDFAERSRIIDRARQVKLPQGYPFPYAMDVLGDGSLLAVDLPGHADGQIGLLLSTHSHNYLLCADAAWSSRAYRENRPPHPLTGLITPSFKQYANSFNKLVALHRQHPELRIVPSHCPEVWENWIQGGAEW